MNGIPSWTEPALIACAIMMAVVSYGLYRMQRNAQWHTVAEGALNRIEFKEVKHSYRTGARVHRSRHYLVRHNTLHFEGGTVLYGIQGRLKNPGTVLVRVMQNDYGQYRLDPIGSRVPSQGESV